MGQIVFMIPEKYEQIKASPEREIYEPENACPQAILPGLSMTVICFAAYTAASTWTAE